MAAAEVTLVGSGRRAEESRRRRASMVQAAAAVLGRRGCVETSLKEIAREAGVAPGLLHYHFASKDELLIAVTGELDRELSDTWAEAVRGIDDPLERLCAGLDAIAAHRNRRPELWRVLSDLSMLSLGNPALRDRCRELWGRFVAGVEAEVRGALGRLPAYALVPPRELAGAIAAAVEGTSWAGLIDGGDPGPRFQALKVMLLSVVVTAHVTAGEEPPVARLAELARPR